MRAALLFMLSVATLACQEPTPSSPPKAPRADAGPGEAQQPPNAVQCTTLDGAAGTILRAFYDADGDGHAGTPGVSCVGLDGSLPTGYSATSDDCDDMSPAVWSPQPFYPDRDHDGAGEEPADLLCSSSPPLTYHATVDDCAPNDPKRWRLAPYSYRDEDGDGLTVPLSGKVCAGFALPFGYADWPSGLDCDDGDPGAWAVEDGWRDWDGDGFGAGPKLALCTGDSLLGNYAARGDDCDDGDATRRQMLPYEFRDADGDHYSVAESGLVCGGYSLPQGYSTSDYGLADCDDRNRSVGPGSPVYLDQDGDGVGDGSVVYLCSTKLGHVAKTGDCAPDDPARWQMLSYWYRDVDGDGWTLRQSGQICSGTLLPASYLGGSGKGDDCDDADASVHARLTGHADADGDDFGAGNSQTFCTAGALPAGYVTNSTDCAPDDANIWRSATNLFVDRDGDGYTNPEAGSICIGEQLPPPYIASANGNDCDDANEALWNWVVVYPDRDGDGVGAPPRQVQCLGAAIPPGFSTAGWDSNDGDPTVQADPTALDVALAE